MLAAIYESMGQLEEALAVCDQGIEIKRMIIKFGNLKQLLLMDYGDFRKHCLASLNLLRSIQIGRKLYFLNQV